MMQLKPLISVSELQALIKSQPNNLLIIDARFDLNGVDAGNLLYAQGHIPNACRLDLDKDLCGVKTGTNGRHPLPNREALVHKLQAVGLNQNDHIVVYDQMNSMFSAHLWWLFQWLGHTNIQVLDGGFSAWVRHQGAVSKQSTPDNKKGDFQARPSNVSVANVEYILKHLNRPDVMQVIDARATERFKGEIEPLDPVAGHIPGAINRPFALNLNEDGTYKSPLQLRKEWEALLGQRPLDTIVHQCGSGVSACHNVLALAHAGYGVTTLYPGSWSEWCADPSRPVTKI